MSKVPATVPVPENPGTETIHPQLKLPTSVLDHLRQKSELSGDTLEETLSESIGFQVRTELDIDEATCAAVALIEVLALLHVSPVPDLHKECESSAYKDTKATGLMKISHLVGRSLIQATDAEYGRRRGYNMKLQALAAALAKKA